MVTVVEMTVWIQSVWSCEKVKDQDVDEAHGKSEGVYSKGGVVISRNTPINVQNDKQTESRTSSSSASTGLLLTGRDVTDWGLCRLMSRD